MAGQYKNIACDVCGSIFSFWRSCSDGKKRCPVCIEKRALEQKPTRRRKNLLQTTYGMSLEDYAQIFTQQNGLCKICKTNTKQRQLAVDHCHKTGKIRGLLCAKCNVAIGMFEDNIEFLTEAISYLKENA